MDLQRNVRTNFTQRLSHAIASDAAANGEYFASKREYFLAYMIRDELFSKTPPQLHDLAPDFILLVPSTRRKRRAQQLTRLRRGAGAQGTAIRHREHRLPAIF